MLKNISKINGVSKMNSSKQKSVQGGIKLGQSCAVTCSTQSSGRCGPPHCPGFCTGNGGYILL